MTRPGHGKRPTAPGVRWSINAFSICRAFNNLNLVNATSIAIADQLLSLDACNSSGFTHYQNCPGGGQLGMWKSPALRGPKADWQHVGPVFTSNATVLDDGFLSKEFVTIDYVGMLEGDPAPAKGTASGTRLFLNNVGGNGGGDGCCSGTTSYFPVMQAAPGAPLTQVAPQGMVDWGSFTFAEGSRIPGTRPPPPGATGVQLLSGMASRGLSMARTLGSEESDQVNKPGRRESNADRSFTGPCSVLALVLS